MGILWPRCLCLYFYICVFGSVCLSVCMFVCLFISVYMFISVCTFLCVLCISECMWVHMCFCLYMFLHFVFVWGFRYIYYLGWYEFCVHISVY